MNNRSFISLIVGAESPADKCLTEKRAGMRPANNGINSNKKSQVMKTKLTLGARKFGATLFLSLMVALSYGQTAWPISGNQGNTKVSIFKPVVETFDNSHLSFRAAVATNQDDGTPVFGSIWGEAQVTNNTTSRLTTLTNVTVTDVRFPDDISDAQQAQLQSMMQQIFNDNRPSVKMDDILADLQVIERETQLSSTISHEAPKILYSNEASLLVSIDGDPVFEETSTNGIQTVANTPFLILKYQNQYYLSNGQQWYKASSVTGNYVPEKNTPKAVKTLAASLKSDEEAAAETEKSFYPKIIVSTVPAELIQTDGDPTFSAIQGTSLLYVSNTEDQMLINIEDQSYYVLLSGRWYTAKTLNGPWDYVEPKNLPADFAKIPEGSDKDMVLASVPGTQAATNAVRDAQVPQTAAVDRKTATAEVTYDGEPLFEPVQGTTMQLASNSSNIVLSENATYYLVDNGVWFSSKSPNGPWTVSDYRPQQVNDIPPSSPAYNVKYVNIYYSTPEVVYVGYTSGYLANYIIGPTIVYGTGYYYRPWRGRYYFPRPCTWGFGMNYNPWYGWTINIGYGVGGYGWFGYYPGWSRPHHHHHYHSGWGWWGPPVYRPPYGVPCNHYYGPKPVNHRPIRYASTYQTRPITNTRPSANAGSSVSNSRPSGNSRPTATTRATTSTRPVASTNIYSNNRSGVSATRGGANTTGDRTRPTTTTTTPSREGNTTINNNQSTTRPSSGSGTTTRPSTGTNTPSTTRPSSNTGTNTQPTTRPSTNTGTGTQPTTRPSATEDNKQPTTRPSNTGTSTSTQPTTRPSSGTENTNRQTARPSSNSSSSQQAPNRQSTNSSSKKQNVNNAKKSNTSRQGTSNSNSSSKRSNSSSQKSSQGSGRSSRR